VTHLRKMMLEDLQRRNYSQDTIRCYIHTVEDFSRRFNRSPDRLGPQHIREYQAELFQKRKLSAGTVTVSPVCGSVARQTATAYRGYSCLLLGYNTPKVATRFSSGLGNSGCEVL
jgi:Phage integrase, N-terminal SAM-like domain